MMSERSRRKKEKALPARKRMKISTGINTMTIHPGDTRFSLPNYTHIHIHTHTHLKCDKCKVPLGTLLDLDGGHATRHDDFLDLRHGQASGQVAELNLVYL